MGVVVMVVLNLRCMRHFCSVCVAYLGLMGYVSRVACGVPLACVGCVAFGGPVVRVGPVARVGLVVLVGGGYSAG